MVRCKCRFTFHMIHENTPEAIPTSTTKNVAAVVGFTNAYCLNAKLHDQADPELKRVGRSYVQVPITIPHWIMWKVLSLVWLQIAKDFPFLLPLDFKERV